LKKQSTIKQKRGVEQYSNSINTSEEK